MIDFITENFHDTYILSVLENTSDDIISMTVDYPVNWQESLYEKKCLIFTEAHNYTVNEIRFVGSPQILEIEIVSEEELRIRYRLITNAGYREISCEKVQLLDLVAKE